MKRKKIEQRLRCGASVVAERHSDMRGWFVTVTGPQPFATTASNCEGAAPETVDSTCLSFTMLDTALGGLGSLLEKLNKFVAEEEDRTCR